jgi:hypothetical protein
MEYGGWAILFLGGYSCHHSDEFLDACPERGILSIVFLPAHRISRTLSM